MALDAASRGYSVALLEQSDFGKGTSSRSTKLIHGGVRYLAQGNVNLVREALYERAVLLRNAPGLVRRLGFVIPASSLAEAAWYRLGIGVYDLLAGSQRIGTSRWLSSDELRSQFPGGRLDRFRAGVLFHDGQFDDARLLIAMARTATKLGAVLLNYAEVKALMRGPRGEVAGVVAQELESGSTLEIPARVVINATGVFADRVRQLQSRRVKPYLTLSQGSHLVLDRSFLPSEHGLLVPNTPDGRVLFAIPWHGHTLVGTTDVEIPEALNEPTIQKAEVDFILETASGYLAKIPVQSDIRSAFSGIRPLVRSGTSSSARLSRDHSIFQEESGLITIVGGKWTTYRRMAQDCVDVAARQAGLPQKPCRTAEIGLVDDEATERLAAERIARLECTDEDVRRAVHVEMARTVEDVLSRRSRILLLDVAAAVGLAPRVAAVMARELGRAEPWASRQVEEFQTLAARSSVGAPAEQRK